MCKGVGGKEGDLAFIGGICSDHEAGIVDVCVSVHERVYMSRGIVWSIEGLEWALPARWPRGPAPRPHPLHTPNRYTQPLHSHTSQMAQHNPQQFTPVRPFARTELLDHLAERGERLLRRLLAAGPHVGHEVLGARRQNRRGRTLALHLHRWKKDSIVEETKNEHSLEKRTAWS